MHNTSFTFESKSKSKRLRLLVVYSESHASGTDSQTGNFQQIQQLYAISLNPKTEASE